MKQKKCFERTLYTIRKTHGKFGPRKLNRRQDTERRHSRTGYLSFQEFLLLLLLLQGAGWVDRIPEKEGRRLL